MGKRPLLLVGILVLAFAGGALGASMWASRRSDRDMRSVALAQQLYEAGLCARILSLLEEGRQNTAVELLESNLVSALREMDRSASSGPIHRDQVFPGLVESGKEAQRYARDHGLEGVAEAERAFDRMGVSP